VYSAFGKLSARAMAGSTFIEFALPRVEKLVQALSKIDTETR
jgi:hypothetical protein